MHTSQKKKKADLSQSAFFVTQLYNSGSKRRSCFTQKLNAAIKRSERSNTQGTQ